MLINQAKAPTENVDTNKEILTVENEYWVSLHEALERLENGNPQPDDFKKVILDGYFKDKAINGVSMLAHEHVKQHGLRPDVMEQLVAISNLEDYFITIHNLGSIPVDEDED